MIKQSKLTTLLTVGQLMHYSLVIFKNASHIENALKQGFEWKHCVKIVQLIITVLKHLLIYSLIYQVIHSFMYLIIHSAMYSFIYLFTYLFIYLLIYFIHFFFLDLGNSSYRTLPVLNLQQVLLNGSFRSFTDLP